MPTTIQVKNNTLERLKFFKNFSKESYDEVINKMLNDLEEGQLSDEVERDIKIGLREIKEGIGLCPETGGPINGTECITTPWINLTLNSTSNLFEVNVNTTDYNFTSGSYWLEAKAEDILGNKAEKEIHDRYTNGELTDCENGISPTFKKAFAQHKEEPLIKLEQF